tara:strand:+ start:622 stop:1260 length:639 start_codon:yes stop_codon:yes gene_type:complete
MILGVIPARGGSKGIPGKNVKKLLGKYLINWSIEAAQQSKFLDRFIVSTENDEIASIAKQAGAEVLIRPSEFATDHSTTVSVLQHVIEEIDADIIVLLQPTSPVRVDNIIDRSIDAFKKSGCDTLATGYSSHHFEWGTFKNIPRQALKAFFHDDGNVYIFKTEVLKAGRWIGDKPYRMEVPGYYSIEIDDISEFWANEGILKRLLNGNRETK